MTDKLTTNSIAATAGRADRFQFRQHLRNPLMPIADRLVDDIADLDFTTPQREKLIRYLSAKKDDADSAPEMATLTGAISAAESAAIDRRRIPALNQIKSQLRRWGYVLKDTEICDQLKLDQCFAGRDVTERLALKTNMRALGLLPRVA